MMTIYIELLSNARLIIIQYSPVRQ